MRARWRGMSFRRRLTLAGAVAVAVAVALASVVTYLVVRGELLGQVDDELAQAAAALAHRPGLGVPDGDNRRAEGARPPAPPPGARGLDRGEPPFGPRNFAQIVRSDGTVVRPPGSPLRLEPGARARAVAAAGRGSYYSNREVGDAPLRVLTRAIAPGAAIQVARPRAEIVSTLDRLRLVLALVSAGGVALAAALGLAVTRTALRPVRELTGAAEHVTRTRDLRRRIEARGDDELARLARSFNAMLEALEASMRAQRSLVADASHELRTPLTSLRTNVEVLAAASGMAAADRRRLLADAVGQIEELTGLVGDLVELARDEDRPEQTEALRLDELVAGAVERARRRHPDRVFALDAAATMVEGAPARLDRAVTNLLDNAHTWSPAGAAVEVSVSEGEVSVRDHGPGIAAEDLPHVFDRFYRSPAARGLPGSGLGLAIVRSVAEAHGGSVRAGTAEGGGALMVLSLPPEPAAAPGGGASKG